MLWHLAIQFILKRGSQFVKWIWILVMDEQLNRWIMQLKWHRFCLLHIITQLVRTPLRSTFNHRSLTFTSVASKPLANVWFAMSEMTRTSRDPGSLLFFKFNLLCTTYHPHTHIFLQNEKFCCPPLLGPVLGGLPVERRGRTLVKQGPRLSGFSPQLYLRLLGDQLYPVVLIPHLSSEDNSTSLAGGGED